VFTLSFVQWIWCDQFNFLSKCTLRYFVVFEIGIIILFNVIGGQILCLSVKVICFDWVLLILTSFYTKILVHEGGIEDFQRP